MRQVLDVDDIDGEMGRGLEIFVPGFKHDLDSTDDSGTQVHIEIYNGKLFIRVWDGSSEDPAHTVEIERL